MSLARCDRGSTGQITVTGADSPGDARTTSQKRATIRVNARLTDVTSGI